MLSPWQSPLPLDEYTTSRVVVYFYSGRLNLWIPTMFFPLAEAIAFYYKGILSGMELLIFPTGLDPCYFDNSFNCDPHDSNLKTLNTSHFSRVNSPYSSDALTAEQVTL